MTRVAVVLLLVLLAAAGIFLYLQLDAMTRLVDPEDGALAIYTFAIEFGDTPESARHGLTADVLDVLRGRLEALGYEDAPVRSGAEGQVRVGLPPLAAERQQIVFHSLMRPGTLALRIEVLPDAEYRNRIAAYRDPPRLARTGVWPDEEPGSFEAFKRKEIDRWRPDGSSYEPSDPRFRLVWKDGAEGTREEDFHVVEAAGFDGSILEEAFVSEAELGMPVVVFEVRDAHQDAFERWTTQNVGLPMALVVDGEFQTAPIVMDALRRNVQITLGQRGSRKEQQAEAESLAAALSTKPLPLALRLKSIQQPPKTGK